MDTVDVGAGTYVSGVELYFLSTNKMEKQNNSSSNNVFYRHVLFYLYEE